VRGPGKVAAGHPVFGGVWRGGRGCLVARGAPRSGAESFDAAAGEVLGADGLAWVGARRWSCGVARAVAAGGAWARSGPSRACSGRAAVVARPAAWWREARPCRRVGVLETPVQRFSDPVPVRRRLVLRLWRAAIWQLRPAFWGGVAAPPPCSGSCCGGAAAVGCLIWSVSARSGPLAFCSAARFDGGSCVVVAPSSRRRCVGQRACGPVVLHRRLRGGARLGGSGRKPRRHDVRGRRYSSLGGRRGTFPCPAPSDHDLRVKA
jgi:hypothetical protein